MENRVNSLLSENVVKEVISTAVRAGIVVRELKSHVGTAESKVDGSPVTQGDTKAEQVILASLPKLFPELPIVSEESASDGAGVGANTQSFLLVDPLDGTKEYIQGRTDYTVNIALVEHGVPAFGVVVAPELNAVYVGDGRTARRLRFGGDGRVSDECTIAARVRSTPLTAVVSGSHLDERTVCFMEAAKVQKRMSVGSSLKFCRLATGEADIYPRLARTMQWDTAAGDAVLRSAGGHTYDMEGREFLYGPFKTARDDAQPFANSHFIAFGDWQHGDMLDHVRLTRG